MHNDIVGHLLERAERRTKAFTWREAADMVAPKSTPPCDCIQKEGEYYQARCYCQNHGDGESASVWCEQRNLQEQLLNKADTYEN